MVYLLKRHFSATSLGSYWGPDCHSSSCGWGQGGLEQTNDYPTISTCHARWHWGHCRRCQLLLDSSTPSSCVLLVRYKSKKKRSHRNMLLNLLHQQRWLIYSRPCGLPFKWNVGTSTPKGRPLTFMSSTLSSRGLTVTLPSDEIISSSVHHFALSSLSSSHVDQ